jgi:hypothetical protein
MIMIIIIDSGDTEDEIKYERIRSDTTGYDKMGVLKLKETRKRTLSD